MDKIATEFMDQTSETPESPVGIRLDQFLQMCGVPTGGQAKRLIQSGDVLVNGVVETRRRRKVNEGDEVAFAGEVYGVGLEP